MQSPGQVYNKSDRVFIPTDAPRSAQRRTVEGLGGRMERERRLDGAGASVMRCDGSVTGISQEPSQPIGALSNLTRET